MSIKYSHLFVSIAAINLEELVNFYRQLLGKNSTVYIPGRYVEFDISGLKLGIFRPKPEDEAEFSESGKSGMSICIEVENLEQAITHLTGMGYAPKGEINIASHGREIYAYDPAGNRLILHQS